MYFLIFKFIYIFLHLSQFVSRFLQPLSWPGSHRLVALCLCFCGNASFGPECCWCGKLALSHVIVLLARSCLLPHTSCGRSLFVLVLLLQL